MLPDGPGLCPGCMIRDHVACWGRGCQCICQPGMLEAIRNWMEANDEGHGCGDSDGCCPHDGSDDA